MIYLDHQATTPCDPRVAAAMLPYFGEHHGNPASQHEPGRRAADAVERARAEIAALINARPAEIIFTPNATTANNLAIAGHFDPADGHPANIRPANIRLAHVVTCITEHASVLEPCRRLRDRGVAVTELPVAPDGLIDMNRLEAALCPETRLVSIMAVNNEIGVIQPIAPIGALCRERGIFFHCDAAQAAGKIPIDVRAMQIDLLTLSAHKLYGPPGIGALFIRDEIVLRPLMQGGGQERGLSPGSLATPLCIGFGQACVLAKAEMAAEAQRIGDLRRRLLEHLSTHLPGIKVNGTLKSRVPGNLNLCFPGIDGGDLIDALPGLAISGGSACDSGTGLPSRVLLALGLSVEDAHASLRIGIGRMTQQAEIDQAAAQIIAAIHQLQTA